MNPQLFLSGYGYRPHASGEFDSESGHFSIRSPEWKKINPQRIACGRVNPDIFESDDVANSCPISYRTVNQYGDTTATTGQIAATIAPFMAHALNSFYCRGALGTTVNPNTIGCVRTGEFDLNTLRVDGEIFES